MSNPVRRFLSLAAMVVSTNLLSGCGGPENRALVVFSVKVATDVPDFKTLMFTGSDDPSSPSRSVDGPSHRAEFQFGYFVSHPSGALTVVARALRDDGCVVGQGSVMVTGVESRKQVQGGVLTVTKIAVINCDPGDGGQDRSDGAVDVADTVSATIDLRDEDMTSLPEVAADSGAVKLGNGTHCTADLECSSGHCIDQVCCESECKGQCSSCNEPDGSAGKCLIVTGTPRGARERCGGTAPCNARCDGTDGTACKYPGSSVQCVPGACLDGMATVRTICDGVGACTKAMTSMCPSNQCADKTRCSGGCSGASPCDAGMFCDATGVCLPTKANGDSCQNDTECNSTFCADSVCCSGACSGQCQACNEPQKAGTCITIAGAPRGSRPACTGTQATCAGRCGGTIATSCSYPGDTAVCSPATCSGSFSLVSASVCSGSGTCTIANTRTCDTGTYCSGGVCVPQVDNGAACQNAAQCRSGNCTGAVCCLSGQTGCSGVCKNLATDSANCGTCGHGCAGSSCVNGSLAAATTCNGAGSCTIPTMSACPTNQCADSTKCSAGCSVALPCGAGKFCDSTGVCLPTKATGSSCQMAGECQDNYCTSCYPDRDGDGHGDSRGSISRFCGFCMLGFVADNVDCYDGNTSAQPGMTAFFDKDRGDGSFDYNCDGREERVDDTVLVLTKCFSNGSYESMRIPSPACGETWQQNDCVPPGVLVPKTNTVFCR